MNVAACAGWALLAAALAAGAGLASAGGQAVRGSGAGTARASAAAAGAAPAPRSVARTQVCTVHKELRIGDYVMRHETCRDAPQAEAKGR